MNLRLSSLTAVAIAGALTLPGAALAKGGSTPTAPPEPAINCYDGSVVPLDVSPVFTNQVGNAGCVTVESLSTGYLRLYGTYANQNWRVVVVSSGGTGNTRGVQVDFINTYTGYKASARIQPGKTDIRG
jgi:hypothetical protein